jgi:hypothetical protein
MIKSSFCGPVVWLTASSYRFGTQDLHKLQEECMRNVTSAVRAAIDLESGMHLLDVVGIENRFSQVTGIYDMHRPDHVVSVVAYQFISFLACLFSR